MNWIKSVINLVWDGAKKILPDKVKRLVTNFLRKNEKLMVLLEPTMDLVKFVALSYGAGNVVSIVTAIQRMLESWGVFDDARVLPFPSTIKVVLDKKEMATLEEAKVALRDLVKVLMYKTNYSDSFDKLNDSEKNLLIEMAYSMVKDEIKEIKENVSANTTE